MYSPKRVQGLFLAVTLLFAAAVGWLGWRLLDQDRALARQRRLEQLEAAADRVTGALYQRLAEFEEALAGSGRGRLPAGAVLVRTRRGSVEVRPPDGLLYQPLPPDRGKAPAVFEETDRLEFEREDPSAAATALGRLAASKEPAVAAAAMLRLGRNLRKARQPEEALDAYGRLAAMGAVMVDGLPAELVALEGRCALFAELGRRAELEREARILYGKLMSAKWRVGKSTYDFQVEQLRQWLRQPPQSREDGDKERLSCVADRLWQAWRREAVSKGRKLIAGDRPVLAAWSSDEEQWTALLAPAKDIEAALGEAGWLAAALTDGEGRPLLGRTDVAARLKVERTTASTKLPWTLQVTTSDDGTNSLAGRQWLIGGGFALLVSLLAGVSIVVARAVTKEMAAARLQADFVAAVSHEFRSPLASISQIAELLEGDRWPTEGHRRKGCEILTRETWRLRRLVEALLDFAKAEAGKNGYRMEPFAVTEMVQTVVEEFRQTANGGEVQISMAAELPKILGDREALARALWNLLENGVKYSGGRVRVWVEASNVDGRLGIRVRDEGIGIPATEQAHIFEKFYRGSEAKARGIKGTGIGLAMVRHIVEAHGGEVWVESAPGRGSTFTVLLPGEGEG